MIKQFIIVTINGIKSKRWTFTVACIQVRSSVETFFHSRLEFLWIHFHEKEMLSPGF